MSNDVQRRQAAAFFYAAGRRDEAAEWAKGGFTVNPYASVHESDFALWAANQARDFYEERTSHLKSVQDQWTEYLKERQ
jgi:hypothetical protein